MMAGLLSNCAAAQVITAAPTDWFKTAIIYAIFPRSFADSNGDGIGDLRGIAEKLDYIQGLGANTIWLMPPFVTPSYHGYNVADYYHIDPSLGTDADLVNLIQEVHKRHMYFILDYVANHTANTHPFFLSAYGHPDSSYTNYYHWLNPEHTAYEHFSTDLTMPRLNYDNPAVGQYMLQVARFYLDMGVDGFRCDVAGMIPHTYWQQLRKIINANYPGRILLGEFWTDRDHIPDFLDSGEFDASFDFPVYMDLVTLHEFNGMGVLNGKTPVATVVNRLRTLQKGYLVRFLGNHDTNRLMSIVQNDKVRDEAAIVWLLTLPGPIQIYQGDELGVTGSKSDQPALADENVRLPFPWHAGSTGKFQTNWAQGINTDLTVNVDSESADSTSLYTLVHNLLTLRNTNPIFAAATYEWPSVSQDIYELRRWDSKGQIIVFVNFSTNIQHYPLSANDPLNTARAMVDTGVYQDAPGVLRLNPGGYAVFETALPVGK